MNLKELGVSEDMLNDIVNAVLILEGGYKLFDEDDVRNVLMASI